MKGGNNTEALYKEIGVRIHKIVDKHGETHEILAKALGYSAHQTVTYWANGTRPVPLEKLLEISRRYNVSMDYLTTRTDADTKVSEEGKELQFVCDRTGLSVKAVKELQELPRWAAKWADSDIRSMLNLVIENYAFELCNGLQRIESAKNKALSAINHPVSSPTDPPGIKLDALQDSQKELELALFNFTEICRQIADEFDSYNVLLDCKKAYYEVVESIPLEAKWEGSEDGEHISTSEN